MLSCGPFLFSHGSCSFFSGVFPASSDCVSQPQTTATSRATGMREKRPSASCDPVSQSLLGFLEHFRLPLVFEYIFWQALVRSRGCLSRWKILPIWSSASQHSQASWTASTITAFQMSVAFLHGDLGSIAWEIIRRG